MNYKGEFSRSVNYNPGDVVVYTDGVPYCLAKPAAMGTTPHNTLYWSKMVGGLADVVILFHDMFTGLLAADAVAAETTMVVNSMLFDDKTIVLKSSTEDSDKVYAITVDDSDGLEATEIEDEGGEDGES